MVNRGIHFELFLERYIIYINFFYLTDMVLCKALFKLAAWAECSVSSFQCHSCCASPLLSLVVLLPKKLSMSQSIQYSSKTDLQQYSLYLTQKFPNDFWPFWIFTRLKISWCHCFDEALHYNPRARTVRILFNSSWLR